MRHKCQVFLPVCKIKIFHMQPVILCCVTIWLSKLYASTSIIIIFYSSCCIVFVQWRFPWNWLFKFLMYYVLWPPLWFCEHTTSQIECFHCWATNYRHISSLKHLCLLSHTCVVPKSITVWFSSSESHKAEIKWRSCIGRLWQRI